MVIHKTINKKMNYTSLVKYESTTSIATVWIRTCVLNDFTSTKMFKPKFYLKYYRRQYSPTVLSVAKTNFVKKRLTMCNFHNEMPMVFYLQIMLLFAVIA